MKKLLAGGTLAILAFGGMIASAAPASAHTPNVTADCGAVNVDLRQYSGADLTVVIDGVEVETLTFDREFVKSYEISRTANHEWSIDVQAHDNDRYDYQQAGSTTACETTPPAEVVPPATPETVAGCAASLDDVVLPENTEAITYSKTEAGVVATLVSDKYTFPEDLGNYVLQEDGTALLPTEYIVIEEECAEPTPEPSPSVEPSEEASVPPAAEPSASPSPEAEETEELAATGATVGGAIAFAALLALGGVALVWARKRMQQNA